MGTRSSAGKICRDAVLRFGDWRIFFIYFFFFWTSAIGAAVLERCGALRHTRSFLQVGEKVENVLAQMSAANQTGRNSHTSTISPQWAAAYQPPLGAAAALIWICCFATQQHHI